MPALTAIPREIASLADYEPFARERMSAAAWAYLSGGSADEITLRRNRGAFDELLLSGRVLAELGQGHTKLTLLGQELDHPILLAPVAYQKLAHPDGERAAVLGAAASKTPFVVSTHASVSLEELARTAAGSALWFQLYVQEDRGFTAELARRAEKAGCQALVVTLDAPVNSARNREQRAGFALPEGVEAASLRGLGPKPAYVGGAGESLCGGILERAPTWKDVAWLRALTGLPLILKGVTAPAEAVRAADEGVDALIVSNHGGRSLDTLPASIELLPRIAERVGERLPLLLDGGIRRGTDVLKALALGARAILIGRPYIHGLAAAGAPGVAHVVHILRAELEVAMALSGCRNLGQIDRTVLWDSR